ncbi:MAG: 3-hydroxy-3-methylglutaryl-CoA reductase, partial [Candidatus Woesebacteria bacterium]
TRTTSAHTHYLSHHSWIRGKDLYVRFVFDTDEAMGMNMATIATDALARKIMEHFPNVSLAALSSNVCTDKKDSQINKVLGRGHWVQAEVMLPSAVVSDVLKTTPRQMERVHIQKNLVGTNIAGSFSQNAQVANVVAAIYVATGQDFAHIVEGSSADLSCENTTAGLYVALTLPSILVGVVGGGTYLPAQAQARQLIGNGQEITSEFLAAVVGATSLAGEISLLAALAQGVLAQSHQRLGRGKK